MKNISPGSWTNSDNIRRVLKLVIILMPLALAGNIAYVVLTSNPDLFRDLNNFHIEFFALAVMLALLPWFGQSVGIIIWSKVFRVNIRSTEALSAVLASDIGAAITPTALGGSYAKLAFLIDYGFNPPQATLVTFLGGLADALFFAVALPIAILWTRTWENPAIVRIWREFISHWPVVVIIVIVLIVFLFVLKLHRIKRAESVPIDGEYNLVSRVYRGIGNFKDEIIIAARFVLHRGKKAFLACVLFSGIGWCGRYGAISALVAGLGYAADPVLYFLLQWLVFTTMTMVPTPGAIGGAEVSFAVIYNGLIPPHAIPIATTAWRFVTFYLTVGLASVIFAVSRLGVFPRATRRAEIVVNEKTKA